MKVNRPELRLLLDFGDITMPMPVYLDRTSPTEALMDYHASVLERFGHTGAALRADTTFGVLATDLANRIDGYLGLLAYLAKPEADIVNAARPGARPVKPRRPKRDKDVWLVGYTNLVGSPS